MTKVIGIDLGTTFSAIASLDDLGNPEVLASIEDNRKITASAVYLKNNEVIMFKTRTAKWSKERFDIRLKDVIETNPSSSVDNINCN